MSSQEWGTADTSMEYKRLGNTDLDISEIMLGTAELGMDYGFRNTDQYTKPDRRLAIAIIHRAIDLGITWLDTARSYGASEEIIGHALNQLTTRVHISSKVAVSENLLGIQHANILRGEIKRSINTSLQALRREAVDLMQLHNASLAILSCEEVMRALEDAQQEGKVRFLGVSCYEEDVALAALKLGRFQALQMPFNILDRKIIARVLPGAVERGIGVVARSVFLRGVLTENINSLPDSLRRVREAALPALYEFTGKVHSLSELALRFVLSFNELASVVIGVRSMRELESNMANYARGRLSPDQVQRLLQLSVVEPSLLDTKNWVNFI